MRGSPDMTIAEAQALVSQMVIDGTIPSDRDFRVRLKSGPIYSHDGLFVTAREGTLVDGRYRGILIGMYGISYVIYISDTEAVYWTMTDTGIARPHEDWVAFDRERRLTPQIVNADWRDEHRGGRVNFFGLGMIRDVFDLGRFTLGGFINWTEDPFEEVKE